MRRFDPSVTVESAVTPPSSWFVDDKFYELDQVSRTHFMTLRPTPHLEAVLVWKLKFSIEVTFQHHKCHAKANYNI